MSHKIIDNFLDKEPFKAIQKIFTSEYFPWYFNEKVNDFDKEIYFTHMIYNEFISTSPHFNTIINLVLRLQPKSLIRIKANLYLKTKKLITHAPHVDYPFSHKGAIFYLNTNNGKTILENGKKIDSVANRILFFDASKEHSSTSCTDEKRRLNINFNFF
jgi:hypothetical protein